MATVIELPKLSDTMEEGGIASWLKKEGEAVSEGEPLVEIETDKATMEWESPAEGVLLKILVNPGKTIKLRTPIAVIGEKGEKVDLDQLSGANVVDMPGAKAPAKAAAPAPKAAPAPAAKAAPATTPVASPNKGYGAGTAATGGTPAPQAKQVGPVAGGDDRVKSSPLARKFASEHGVDIGAVHGSGPGGRIVMRDVEEAVKSGGAAAPAARGPAPAAPQPVVATGEDRVVPLSMMRKTIAKRLLAGKNEAPHFYLTVSANMARLDDWRKRLNDEAAKSDGRLPKVSVNDLVIMAAAKALRLHPNVNASWQGESILQFGNVHVAMAVALPTGLVTPVVRHADHLGVREIARQTRDLATRAKDGKLGNEDYSGGTFTISNLGMFGIEEFTAIINPPQAAILAVGATIATPWVDEKGQVVAQPRMKMTLSCDHRVIDGATGAQFLQTLVRYLEDPLLMLS